MANLIALLIMAVVLLLMFAGLLWVTVKLGPRSTSPAKEDPFETGMVPFRVLRSQVPVKFYLVALLFVVFDVELTFLFPWAVVFRELGVAGFVSMMLFLGFLLLTLVYAWKKGVLSWK